VLSTYFGARCDSHELEFFFRATAVTVGIDREQLVAHKPTLHASGRGIPVAVWIEGRQNVQGILRCAQMNDTRLEKLLNSEPERSQTKVKQVSDEKEALTQGKKPATETGAQTLPPPSPRHSTQLKDDTDALRLFWMAVREQCFFETVDGIVFVGNDKLLQIAQEELDFEGGQGKTANFFRTRVMPFGTRDEKHGFKGWSLDAAKVIAFCEKGALNTESTKASAHVKDPRTVSDSRHQKQSPRHPKTTQSTSEITQKGSGIENILEEVGQLAKRLEQYDSLQEKTDDLQSRVAGKEETLGKLEEHIREMERQLEEMKSKHASVQAEKVELEKQLSDQRVELDELAVSDADRAQVRKLAAFLSKF